MEINQFLKLNQNVQLVINTTDLREFALFIIEEMRTMQESQEKEEVLIRDLDIVMGRVDGIPAVTKSTLWRWAKNGYLKPTKIGKKNYYKRSDLKKLMEE